MFRDKINLILVIFLILGISLLLYPSIADLYNANKSTKIINEYNDSIKALSEKEIEDVFNKAKNYNQRLIKKRFSQDMSPSELKEYNSMLKFGANEAMAMVDIPSINIRLPIFHGTDEVTLQSALGHIEWTSLPVGGESTHCVITGHRGLVSARLFTDLDQLIPGDVFTIRVLNRELFYKVDEITIVEPHEINNILIEKGKDYTTLLTCTPYGVNTHRLLVRGYRIDDLFDVSHVSAEAVRIKPFVVASIMTIPTALILGAIILIIDKNRRKR